MPGLDLRKSLVLLGTAVLMIVLPFVARSEAASASSVLSFTVNSTADAPDANPGDGVCADSAAQCTLRAAIQESDAQPAGTITDVTVPSGTYALSLGPLLVAANTVVVTGAGSSATIVENAPKVKGQLVNVAAGASAMLADLQLRSGRAAKTGGGALTNSGTATLNSVLVTKNISKSGGGLTNAKGATMTLNATTVSNNMTLSGGNNSQPGGSGAGILNAGQLQVTQSTISGNLAGRGGFGSTNPAGRGGSGGGIANTGTVVITSSTISGNAAGSGGIGLSGNEPSGPGGYGGGIYSSGGSVTLTATVVSGNTSGYSGPAGESPFPSAGDGGGVWSSALLQITGSTFTSNTGGTGTGLGASGGAIFSSGKATISSSTFTGNTAGSGSPGGNGGAIANKGTLSLSGSTVSSNSAGAGAGSANGGNGGGLHSAAGSVTLTADTFNANTGGTGGNSIPVDPGCTAPGFGGSGGALYSTATLSMVNTTLSGNTTGQGGFHVPPCAGQAPNGVGAGLATAGGRATVSYSTVADNSDGIDNLAGTVTLAGTIVADNTGPNCAGTISEGSGYNLDSGTTCGFSAATDITGTEPMLGSLANNGGPTATQALQPGSPAVDHGGSASTGCPATDQRGMARPDETADSGACDIGSYESQGLG